MQVNEHEIYTADETQDLLKISQSTFLRLVKKGTLRAYKVGGQYRILGKEILYMVNPALGDRARDVYRKVKDGVKRKLSI